MVRERIVIQRDKKIVGEADRQRIETRTGERKRR